MQRNIVESIPENESLCHKSSHRVHSLLSPAKQRLRGGETVKHWGSSISEGKEPL